MSTSSIRLAGGKEPAMREGIIDGATSWKKQGGGRTVQSVKVVNGMDGYR